MKRLFQAQKWPATAPFSILDHAFIFLPVPYAYATSLLSRAWKRLLQAVRQTVWKAGGGDRGSIHEEWMEDFRHSCWKTKKQIKELAKKTPQRILFSKKAVKVEQAQ